MAEGERGDGGGKKEWRRGDHGDGGLYMVGRAEGGIGLLMSSKTLRESAMCRSRALRRCRGQRGGGEVRNAHA